LPVLTRPLRGAPRPAQSNWKNTELPDVMFAEDRAWLLATLWDDDWSCVGGSRALIDDLLEDPVLSPKARRITTDQYSMPSGHADN
jgi:hypothetical protein